MSKFIITIETQGTSYEPEGADIYLVLSGAFEGSLVTVEAVEQSFAPDPPLALGCNCELCQRENFNIKSIK